MNLVIIFADSIQINVGCCHKTLLSLLEQHIDFFHRISKNTKERKCIFMFCLPCISIHPCHENQLDVLFILSLFRQSTSTCFGDICSPSSRDILCIYIYTQQLVRVVLFSWLPADRPTNSQQSLDVFLTVHHELTIY